MGADTLTLFDDSPRRHLRKLDSVLDQLEELNLRDMSHLPVRLGSALQRLGVGNPYHMSITQLIDTVFDMEEPLLEALRMRRRRT